MKNKNTILSGCTSHFSEENFEKENQIKTFKQNIYSKHVFDINKAKNKTEKDEMIKFNQSLRNNILSCKESELTLIENVIIKMKNFNERSY